MVLSSLLFDVRLWPFACISSVAEPLVVLRRWDDVARVRSHMASEFDHRDFLERLSYVYLLTNEVGDGLQSPGS